MNCWVRSILLRARIGACLEKKWLRDREQRHLDDLRVEKLRSESLLLNVLPKSVVTRMRNGETAIADHFENVTILFSDLVGFTGLATGLPPGKLIDILSAVFSRFDRPSPATASKRSRRSATPIWSPVDCRSP